MTLQNCEEFLVVASEEPWIGSIPRKVAPCYRTATNRINPIKVIKTVYFKW